MSIRTDSHSSAVCELSAVKIIGQANFPPHKLDKAIAIALDEINEILNTHRRHRTYPRIVKRHFAKYHRIKRATDHSIHHPNSPKIHIFGAAA